jgi:hypothetical protein
VSAPKGLAREPISTFGTEFISIFAMPRAIMIMGPSRPWSDRYLFSAFNASQQLSIRFNTLQRYLTLGGLAVLKRVELYPQLPSEPPLKGGRRVASRGSCPALSEA